MPPEMKQDPFAGPGELRALGRAKDWSSTPLGPVASWSTSLRTVVALVLAAPTATILLWGPELVQIYNDAYRLVMGAKHPGGLGQRNIECWPEVWDFTAPVYAGVRERGESFTFTDQRLVLDRPGLPSESYFTLTYSPVRDDDGSIGGIFVSVFETTAQVLARNEREARYRALFASVSEGFCIIQLIFDDAGRAVDYRYVEVNPAFERQTGIHDALGRTVRETTPDIEPVWIETYARVALTGDPARFVNYARPLDRWFEVSAFRIGAAEERRVAVLFTDITERRRAETERDRLVAALVIERARLEEVFRRAPSFIVGFRGPDQTYEFVNEAYYQLVGHREIVGKPLLEAIPEIRDQGFKEILDRVRETEEPWVGRETPVRLERTPGAPLETRYLDMIFQPLTDADGTRAGVIVHGSDITEQVLARREVERLLVESERARAEAEGARREAEEANRAKSEFLAVMSHELRTPLNAIGGYAELLELGVRGPVSDAQLADLARIQQSQRHLLGLINQVLNYTRVDAGAVRYDVAEVPVNEALAAAEALVIPQVRARGLRYVLDGCPPELTVRADREKLQQVLLNLLSNAIKFTESGGEVRVACTSDGDQVAIAVSDTGIGIAPDKLATIFEPFVQVDQRLTRTQEGVGLGLAIARELARGMGGDLVVKSEAGRGSRFTLRLPRG